MSFVLRQTTQLELSQEDEAASGGLGIASALTANRNGSYQSTTSPSIVRSLSTSPDELLDSPPPPPPLSDHRRSSISGTTKQQQHFICSSTTNRGTAPAANNSTTRSIIRIQVWLSWVDFCFVCYVIKKKDTHAHTHTKKMTCRLPFRGPWEGGMAVSTDRWPTRRERSWISPLLSCVFSASILMLSCIARNKFLIGPSPRHVYVYSRKIKTDDLGKSNFLKWK